MPAREAGRLINEAGHLGYGASRSQTCRIWMGAKGILSESIGIPTAFASSWPEFVDKWCLGIPPEAPPDGCGRALTALSKYWPERTQELLTGSMRGLLVVASAIDTGLILDAATHIIGVEPVLLRLRAGEQSSLSELTVGTALSRLGLSTEFGVPAGNKVPDIAITIGTNRVFVEVITPDRAEFINSFTERLEQIAMSIQAIGFGINVELFLDADPADVELGKLTSAIGAAPFSNDVQENPPFGRFLKKPFSLLPVVSPSVASGTSGTVSGVARSIMNGSTGSLAVVRASVFDGRAKRLLVAELHHFSKTTSNILVIDTGNVAGGLTDWILSITRCFQPGQNTRVTAVVLYQMGIIGNPPDAWRAWQVLANPYAANPLPEQLAEVLSRLPKAWPVT